MPRKGQYLKGKWSICPICKKKFWRRNCEIKEHRQIVCSWECRRKYRNKAIRYKDEIIKWYTEEELSISQIAKRLNLVYQDSIGNILKWNNIKIRDRGFYTTGKKNANYKRGYYITSNGYKRLPNKGNPVMEHRLIMERFLGRKLLRTEQVHHLNGNKLDNRIENLALLTARPHGRHSAKQYNDWKKMYQDRITYLEHLVNDLRK